MSCPNPGQSRPWRARLWATAEFDNVHLTAGTVVTREFIAVRDALPGHPDKSMRLQCAPPLTGDLLYAIENSARTISSHYKTFWFCADSYRLILAFLGSGSPKTYQVIQLHYQGSMKYSDCLNETITGIRIQSLQPPVMAVEAVSRSIVPVEFALSGWSRHLEFCRRQCVHVLEGHSAKVSTRIGCYLER